MLKLYFKSNFRRGVELATADLNKQTDTFMPEGRALVLEECKYVPQSYKRALSIKSRPHAHF